MDNTTATIIVGGLISVGALSSALVTGFINLRNGSRTIAAQAEINHVATLQKASELSTRRDEVDNELGKEMRLELRTSLSDTREEVRISREEVKSCRADITTLRHDVENLTHELELSKSERNKEAEARVAAEKTAEQFHISLSKAEDEIVTLRAEIGTLRDQIVALQNERDTLKTNLHQEQDKKTPAGPTEAEPNAPAAPTESTPE